MALPEEIEDDSQLRDDSLQQELADESHGASPKEAARQQAAAQAATGRPGRSLGPEGEEESSRDARNAFGDDGRAKDSASSDARAAHKEPSAADNDRMALSDREKAKLHEVGGKASKLVTSLKALTGNRKALFSLAATGGVIGLVVAVFLGIAQFKLIHIMENMEKHAMARNTHMFEQRRQALYREYFNKYFGPDGAAIDDNTASLTQQVMRSMHDGLDARIREQYDVKIEHSGIDPSKKKLTFKNKVTGEITVFDTATDSADARRFVNEIDLRITHGDGWLKHTWYRHLLHARTGTSWHWLDPIKQPYNKAKVTAANQLGKFLVSSDSKAASIGVKLLDSILGGDRAQGLKDNISQGLTDSASSETEALAGKLVSDAVAKFTRGLTIIGTAIAGIQIACGINSFIENDTFHKLIQAKVEIETMTAAAKGVSEADQLKANKTDANTLNAHMATLTYTDDQGKQHDYTESNDYQRAIGKKVSYNETDNCNDIHEVCNRRIADKAADEKTVAKAFGTAHDIATNPVYKVLSTFVPIPGLPGSITTDVVCKLFNSAAVQVPLGVSESAADAALGVLPFWDDFKKVSGSFIGKVGEGLIAPYVPPIADASIKGPLLAGVQAEGLSKTADAAAGGVEGLGVGNDESKSCAAKQDQSDDSFCAPKMSKDQILNMDKAVAAEQYDDFQHSSTWHKLASIDNSYSVAGRLLDATPSDPKMMVDRTGQTLVAAMSPGAWIKLFRQLPDIFAPRLLAAGADGESSYIVKDDGTDQFDTPVHGFSDEELNNPSNLEDPKYHNITRNVGCSEVRGLTDSRTGDNITLPNECSQAEDTGSGSGSGDQQTASAEGNQDGSTPVHSLSGVQKFTNWYHGAKYADDFSKHIAPTGIILHWWGAAASNTPNGITSGWQSGLDSGNQVSTFNPFTHVDNPGDPYGLGAQFAVTANGDEYQLTPDVNSFVRHATCANTWAIGIEISGPDHVGTPDTNDSMNTSGPKFNAVVDLVTKLVQKFHIPIDGAIGDKGWTGQGIHTHREQSGTCYEANGTLNQNHKVDTDEAFANAVKAAVKQKVGN